LVHAQSPKKRDQRSAISYQQAISSQRGDLSQDFILHLGERAKITSQLRFDCVVPCGKNIVALETERGDDMRRGRSADGVAAAVEVGGNFQAGLSGGSSGEIEDLLIGIEGLAGPVEGKSREETVLDGIPFGGAGRIVSDGDSEAVGIDELRLEFGLPSGGRQPLLPPVSARMSN
jgi:hypothetical protein